MNSASNTRFSQESPRTSVLSRGDRRNLLLLNALLLLTLVRSTVLVGVPPPHAGVAYPNVAALQLLAAPLAGISALVLIISNLERLRWPLACLTVLVVIAPLSRVLGGLAALMPLLAVCAVPYSVGVRHRLFLLWTKIGKWVLVAGYLAWPIFPLSLIHI